jgi:alpha 1,3-glucosidase
MGLYGAIPYLVSHNEHNTGFADFCSFFFSYQRYSVGLLWVNSAETWVDLNKVESEEKIASHWISETGNIDFFLFLGPSPAQTMKQVRESEKNICR